MWSPAIITGGPAAEPLELGQVRQFLRIDADETAFDTELGGYMAAVRADAEKITGSRLITQTVELVADCFADLERLPTGPIQSISGLTYLDSAGAIQSLSLDTDYELYGAGLRQGLRPIFGNCWPDEAGANGAAWWRDRCRSPGGELIRENAPRGAITVTAVVGYGADAEALPQDLYVALLLAVRGLFDDRPVDLAQLLANHRVWL